MSVQVDCVVIGAGVIGLAIGRSMALAGREVIVLERNPGIGQESSSRNSEVIHAGIYYPTASLKARLCVAGKAMLYSYAELKQIPFQRCGKLIVATANTHRDRLDSLSKLASLNGVRDIEAIDASELKRREPELRGIAALWSPSTGIIDSHALMLALQGDLEAADGVVATHAEVVSIAVADDSIRLITRTGDEQSELVAKTLINASGLDAVRLAQGCNGTDKSNLPGSFFAKGNYFSYEGSNPFESLIYPLPVDGGLGIHATLDLAGKLRFGPDVEWIDEIDYSVDVNRRDAFAESIRHYWPALDARDLIPGYAGIRPKLSGPGEPTQDFRIDLAASGRKRQLMHLFGFESPGLTAALAIADEVKNGIDSA